MCFILLQINILNVENKRLRYFRFGPPCLQFWRDASERQNTWNLSISKFFWRVVFPNFSYLLPPNFNLIDFILLIFR